MPAAKIISSPHLISSAGHWHSTHAYHRGCRDKNVPDGNLSLSNTHPVCRLVLHPFFLLTDNVPRLCTNISTLQHALGQSSSSSRWRKGHGETSPLPLHGEKLP